MKGKQVVLGHIGDAKVAALLEDGKLQDVLVEDLSRLPLGSILRAVVDRPVKGIGGVMLRLLVCSDQDGMKVAIVSQQALLTWQLAFPEKVCLPKPR